MNDLTGKDREAPHSHFLQAFMPIAFTIIWILDSFIFKISIIVNEYVHFGIRIGFFVFFLGCSFILMKVSHDTLFREHEPSNTLIKSGILAKLRHPLYFGILLIYVSLLCLSFSLICLGCFILIVIVYNWMTNYEEKILEDIFGQEYIEYKKKVGKWIPKLKKNTE